MLSTEQNIGVNGTSWTFPQDLPEGRRIGWDVLAISGTERVLQFSLAHGGSSFLTRGATVPTRSAMAAPAPGSGFLGVTLRRVGVPFRVAGDEVVEVSTVLAGHPGAAAGLRPDDVIEAVDGQPVHDVEPLILLLSSYTPGTRVSLRVRRGDRVLDIHVELGTRPP